MRKTPRLTRTAAERRRTGVRVTRGILPDEARDTDPALRKCTGFPKNRFRRSASSDSCPLRGDSRGGAGQAGQSPLCTHASRKVGMPRSEAAVSRLEPGIRACKATENVRGRYLLVRGSSSTVGDTARGGSASAVLGESPGTCRSPAGQLPHNAKGCAKSEIGRSGRSEQQRPPLANQAARTDLDRAGSHTER